MRLEELQFTTNTLFGHTVVESQYVSDTPDKKKSTRERGRISSNNHGRPMFWTNSPGVFGVSVLSIEDLETIIKKMKELA